MHASISTVVNTLNRLKKECLHPKPCGRKCSHVSVHIVCIKSSNIKNVDCLVYFCMAWFTLSLCMSVLLCMYVCVCVYIYIYIYIYIHTHTYMHRRRTATGADELSLLASAWLQQPIKRLQEKRAKRELDQRHPRPRL
jgi:hypothetical protein